MLEQFFSPKSIAVIGASRDEHSAGYGILKSLLKGGVFNAKTNRGFKGDIYAINPKAKSILGKKCHASLLEVKGRVELAVIVVPAKIVPYVMEDCAKKGVKGVIIISAGFTEIGEAGIELNNKVLRIAKKANIQIVGPNCLGLIRPSKDLNATFGPCMPPTGEVALFSQSGALVDSVIDWSLERNYGFSAIVSMGNQADLDVCDFLLWAKDDTKTKSIALYLEGLKDGKRFMKVAKEVGRKKPIVVLKSGRSATGMHAVSSHTGSLAGSYAVYKAAFKQCGVHIAETVDDLFEMSEALAEQPPCKNGIAIITNGGGAGVLCTDHCEQMNLKLTPLTKSTVKKLDATGKMHPAYSRHNPLDLVGDATHERYEAAIDIVMAQKDVYGLIVIQTLQTMTEPLLDAKMIIKAKKKYPGKPIIACYMGGKFTKQSVDLLDKHRVPDFNIPYKSAKAMKALVERGIWLSKRG